MSQTETSIARLPHGAKIVPGNAGDHPLIQNLLLETLQVHLEDDFQSRLDDPAYRPTDRLLVRIDDLITAHVHVSNHVGMFGRQRTPLVWLENFATLPEYVNLGHGEALVEAAESIAAHEGAVMALTVTDRPEWFEQRGWSQLCSQGHTRADVRATLAHFDAQEATRRKKRRSRVEIRAWRHLELDVLQNIYDETTRAQWGPLSRSERTWQWLIGRKAHDQILLAVDQRTSSGDPAAAAIGYAVVRDSCVIEMFTLPGHSRARMLLLARACRDAIDRDHHFVSLHTAADDPLHEVMVTAGGAWVGDGANGGQRWMIKLLSPERWVERLYPLMHQQARDADVPRPSQINLTVDDVAYCLTLTRRSARLERTPHDDSPTVCCTRAQFQDLLLGNYSGVALAEDAGGVDPKALHSLNVLLPPRLFWQSPFELIRL